MFSILTVVMFITGVRTCMSELIKLYALNACRYLCISYPPVKLKNKGAHQAMASHNESNLYQ